MLYQPKKLYDLSRRITKLTEELKELISEKEMLLHTLDSTDDADISELKKTIAAMESTLKKLEEQDAKANFSVLWSYP